MTTSLRQPPINLKTRTTQVSSLFADHPDLLKEFTYFLPDAVQEQAKERLNRAARESELRKARQEEQRRMGGGGGGWGRKGYGGRGGGRGGVASAYDRHELERRQKNEARKAKKRASKSLRRDDIHSPYGYTISSERAFFDHVKVRPPPCSLCLAGWPHDDMCASHTLSLSLTPRRRRC